MSIKNYTPGPWVISPASTDSATWDEIYSSDMVTQICEMSMVKTRYVTHEYPLTDDPRKEKAEANAALIAAAPELFEALEGIISIGKRDMSNPKYDEYFNEAKALIKRLLS